LPDAGAGTAPNPETIRQLSRPETARKLTAGATLRVVNLIATTLVAFLMVPFVVHRLGDRMYGIWTLVGTFISYYGLMDLGLSTAVSRFLAGAVGAGDTARFNRLFNAALRLYLCIGAVALCAGSLLAWAAPLMAGNPSDAGLFGKLLLICSLNVALGFPVRVFVGALNANLGYDRTTPLELLTLILRTGGTIFALSFGYGIIGLAWSALLGAVPSMMLYVYLIRRLLPFLRLQRHASMRESARHLFSYSAFVFISQLSDMLKFQVDALVIAGFVGVAAVTHYRIAGTMTQYYIELMIATIGVFQTVFSQQDAQNDHAAVRKTLLLATKISAALSAFVAFGYIVWGSSFIRLWMGQSYLDAYPCLIVLTLGCLVALAQAPSVQLLYGASGHKIYAFMNCSEGIANLVLSLLLVRPYGMLGVALGTMIPMLLVKLFVHPVYVCRFAHIELRQYLFTLWRSFFLSLAAVAIPFLVYRWLAPKSFLGLLLVGAVSVLWYVPFQWLALFTRAERALFLRLRFAR
jgi:O-antigen/teichoic acid export membrane protein